MPPTHPHRRRVLAQALAAAGLLGAAPAEAGRAEGLWVHNVTGLYPVEVARIAAPATVAEVQQAVRDWPGRIGIGGGRYSMGGQVAVRGGLHLDLRGLDRLVWVRPDRRCVRVQAGMRWRDLQDVLDPLGLAVHTMQSYANFTVGGSVSVNAHGRYVGHGPMGHSVRALQLVDAEGGLVDVDRHHSPDLFSAAIGGYGAVGAIVEVQLDVVDNVRIARTVATVPLGAYLDHFDTAVRGHPDSVLHNADLLPPLFDRPVSVTWHRTERPVTDAQRLVPRGGRYDLERNAMWAMTELPGGASLRRSVVQPRLHAGEAVRWLNREASLDVAQLEPHSRQLSTYALQEYFVPRAAFEPFARGLAAVLRRREVAAVNVSVRHSPADTVSLLPWAREEVFSFVLYHKQRTWPSAREAVGAWTRELIDLALAHGGRYYLPYQRHATRAQFERAYPEVAALRALKARVDPAGRWSNALWDDYL